MPSVSSEFSSKAALFYGPEDLRIEESKLDELKHGEILCSVQLALTGGTDIKTYLRGHPRIIKSIPSRFGYEFIAKVEAKNTELKCCSSGEEISVGDLIVPANTAPCYECFFCNKEEYSLCENLDFLNGSFAEHIVIPARIAKHNIYKVCDHKASLLDLAATQTLAVALHGADRSEIREGDNVVIYGLGAIGQSFIKVLKAKYKNLTIIALGRSRDKLALAMDNGATYAISIQDLDADQIEAKVKEIAQYGADVVIEAVGKPEVWKAAMQIARPGALVNFFGGCPKGTSVELDTFKAHYQELKTIGVFHHSPKYIREAFELIHDGKISMANLVSRTMNLDELEEALKLGASGAVMKVAVQPS